MGPLSGRRARTATMRPRRGSRTSHSTRCFREARVEGFRAECHDELRRGARRGTCPAA
jgi:hypothetical protein